LVQSEPSRRRVIAAQAGQALHVLDRFHITRHLNEAVDQVRRAESTRLRRKANPPPSGSSTWPLLRRGSRVRGRCPAKLNALLASKLATAHAWDLKTFGYFWHYKSVIWAGAFLDYWCYRAMPSRLEPMKKVAHMLRVHEPLILNWFRAKGEISTGAVEGSTTKSEWLPDDPTASAPSRPWKLPSTTRWDAFRNQNHPIDSAEQGGKVYPFSTPVPS
jgi:transposase